MRQYLEIPTLKIRIFLMSAVVLVALAAASLPRTAFAASPSNSSLDTAIAQIDTTMSGIVQKYGALNKVSDYGDLSAFRWLAQARAYESMSVYKL